MYSPEVKDVRTLKVADNVVCKASHFSSELDTSWDAAGSNNGS